VPVTVLFADVRGYTALCEQLDPQEVASLVQTFYETSSAALLAQEGLLGQIAGDEIEGIFVPGLAGSNYRRRRSRRRARSCELFATRRSRSGSALRVGRSSSGTSAVGVTRTLRRSAT
jgi:adenylate cyclase